MKFLVVSDIHGRYDRLLKLFELHRDADALMFLGDGLADLERADAYSRGFTVFAVKGNCDGTSFLGRNDVCNEMVLNFDGYRFFLLHGHTRGVKCGFANAVYAAAERESDVLLFGHTHEPIEKYIPCGSAYQLCKPIYIFNPGSLGVSDDGYGRFGLIEIRGRDILFSHGKI